MTPNFALSLSFDGIRLLHRGSSGWVLVGDVSLDSQDLAAELAMLRRTALALDPKGMRCQILLPNEQIKYVSLDTTRAQEEDIRNVLTGATPYPVDELVYDYARGGGRTYVAAVARETLDEAEAFAVEHRFAPVSFSAVPEPFTFVGAPFFGQTTAADKLLGPGETVSRDEAPVVVSGRAQAVASPPVTEVGAATEAKPILPTQKPEAAQIIDAAHPVETESETADTPDAPIVEKAATPEVTPAPLGTPPSPKAEVTEPAIAADKTPEPDDEIAPPTFTRAATPPLTAPARAKPTPPPPPVAAEARNASRVEPVFARRTDESAGSSRPAEPAPKTSAPNDLRVMSPADIGHGTPGPKVVVPSPGVTPTSAPTIGKAATTAPKSRNAPPVTGQPTAKAPVKTPMKTAATSAVVVPPMSPAQAGTSAKAASGGLGAGLTARKSAPTETTVAPPPRGNAAASLTLAGAGPDNVAGDGIGGKPRFLGLILTAILLVFLAAVAAWAAMSSEEGLARWFGQPDDESVTVAAAPEPTPAPVSEPAAVPEPTAAPEPEPVAPAQEALTDAAPAPAIAPDLSAMADMVAAAAREQESASAAEVEAEAEIADAAISAPSENDPLAQTGVAAVAPAGQMISPAEADRVYGDTGVWLRAPRLPLEPRTTTLDLAPRETDTVARPDPAILPELAADAGPTAETTPPTPGAEYPRDAQGFILATPEGTELPSGVLLFAGTPTLTPPLRPGSSTVAGPEADELALDSALAGIRPQPRPGSPTAEEETTDTLAETIAAEAAATEEDPPVADPALAGLRPTPRPGSITLLSEAEPETAADVAAATLAFTADPALAGIRPLPRPGDLAEAAPEPEAEAPVLVNPTSEAVANSIRPDPRPQNFAQVVASAQANVERREAADAEAEAIAAAAAASASAQQQSAAASTQTPEAITEDAEELADIAEIAAAIAASAPAPAPPPATRSPEPAAPRVAAPTGPTPGGVAQAATVANAINLRDINLLGVTGRPNERRALVRLSNGRLARVGVGDALDGGQVVAIDENALNYVKRGRTLTIAMPRG